MYVKYIKANELETIKLHWQTFHGCEYMTPFQYYNWQIIVKSEHRSNLIRSLLCRLRYAVLFSNENNVLAIAPFYIKRIGRKKGIFFIGSGGGSSDYLDFIYGESITKEQILKLLNDTAEKFQCESASLGFIWAGSKSYEILTNNSNFKHDNQVTCVRLILPKSYEEYKALLSKNSRQNIRTAKNRLKKDGFQSRTVVLDNEIVPSNLAKELQKIYMMRFNEKNNDKIKIKEILKVQYKKYKLFKFNPFYSSMINNKNSFTAILYIDDIIASYCYGLKDVNGNIFIMQVAINMNYTRYSPGMILFSNIIENLYEKAQDKLPIIDLTSGDERYKYALGGVEHFSKKLIWTRGN